MRRFFVLLLLLLTLAGVCHWLTVRPPSISQTLAERVEGGPGTVVDFDNIAPFSWDRLYIFGPYTPHKQIQASLGFRWEEINRTEIEHSDSINLIIFEKDG